MKGLLGRKVGMTQHLDEEGTATPVTVIELGPCYVTQIRTVEEDGYQAVQVGFGDVKPRRLTAGERGHLKRDELDMPPLKYLREFRVKGEVHVSEGEKLTADVFSVGDFVDVIGTSKGKGFAGVVKRHHFGGGEKTHGQSDRWRAPGSVGAGTSPGRVFKGKRMAGRMGGERKTIQNLKVVVVDAERNMIAVKGAIPGAKGGLVAVREAIKRPSGS